MQTKEALTFTKGHMKVFLSVLVLNVNTFVWYTVLYTVFPDFASTLGFSNAVQASTMALFFVGIAISAILGANVKIRSTRPFLFGWITMGVISTLSIVEMSVAPPLSAYATAFFLGTSAGLGIPSILACFAEFAPIGNRGTFGGFVWGSSGFLILLLGGALSGMDVHSQFLFLALWRGLALISPILLMKKDREEKPEQSVQQYSAILTDKSLLMYLLPWIMFCLVNWAEAPIVSNLFGQKFYDQQIIFVQFALVGVFALVGGLLSDKVGRKPLTIVGFIFLGIEYALLGFFSSQVVIRYLYVCLDSMVWGMFAAVFFMAVWGDLAERRRKERYYLIGGLPYLMAGYLSVLIRPFLASILVTSAFSLASFFLFLAVLPLLYARETLPEKTMKDKELRSYVEKAKKTKEKYT
jgi:MFS family permease